MFKFIWNYLKNYKRESLVIIICSVLTAVVDLSAPYLTGEFIDKIVVSGDYNLFYKFILLLMSISLLTILVQWLSTILSAKMRTKIANRLVEDMINTVHSLRGEFIFNTDMIYLSKRIEADSNGIVCFAVDNCRRFFIYFAMVVFATFLLLLIGFKWLMIFFVVAIMHIIAYRYLEKTLYERSFAVRETASRYFTDLSDNFLYAHSIKLHGLHGEYISSFKESFAKFFIAVVKEAKIDFWFRSSNLNVNEIFKVIIFLLGGLDVLNGQLKIGSFVQLSYYYLYAMEGVSYFMSFGQNYQDTLAAYTRIMEIKNLSPEINGTKILERIDSIEVRNVSFSFGEQKILSDFSRRFERGKIYCIVGKNGAGKSTLMNLICGMIRPKSGEIFFNGVALAEVDMIHARKNLIAVVEQKDFIKNDTLSGGERRKVSIDTALKKSANVLIMDEPDNNLDAKALDALTKKILDGKATRITLIISHDERLIKISDEVIDFNLGGI